MATQQRNRVARASGPRPATVPRERDRGRRRIIRRHATVRRVDPWTVLKLSFIFYFCMLLVLMVGLMLFWSVINRLGIIETALAFLADLDLEVTINGANIARAIFLLGLLNVVLFTGINVFLAFLYNLVADVIGGLRISLDEEEAPPQPIPTPGPALPTPR